MSSMLHCIHLPRSPMFHHRIEDGQEFTHAGREDHLLGLPSVTQALVEIPNDGIAAGGHQGCHVERSSDMRAAAPHRTFAAERPAIAVKWGNPNECGNLLPVQGP